MEGDLQTKKKTEGLPVKRKPEFRVMEFWNFLDPSFYYEGAKQRRIGIP